MAPPPASESGRRPLRKLLPRPTFAPANRSMPKDDERIYNITKGDQNLMRVQVLMGSSQPTNLPRRLAPTGRSGDVDEDDDVEMGDTNGHSAPTKGPKNAAKFTAPPPANEQAVALLEKSPEDNLPKDLDQLLLIQLHEDLDAWQYDLDFCRAQLDPKMIETISPAETRTFQLRVIDIGHQMRTLRHRIQYIQMAAKNSRDAQATGVGAIIDRNGTIGAANNLYGNYPPGTHYHPQAEAAVLSGPQAYNTTAAANGEYGGVAIRPNRAGAPSSSASAYAGHSEAPQERRGPGRPPGSKNKPRGWLETTPGPLGAGHEKAAALASAGAKRPLTSEIRVATRKCICCTVLFF